MEACGGNGGTARALLTVALDGDGWSASHSDRFVQGKIAPENYWRVGWVGYKACLASWEK